MFLSELSWIPIDHNLLLVLIGGVLLVGALYSVVKGRWKMSEFAIVAVPTGLLMVAVFIPGLSLPGFGTAVPNEDINFTLHIDARLKPWTFNITSIEDMDGNEVSIEPSKYVTIPAGAGYAKTAAYDTLELSVGIVYKLVFTAIDTDHGFLIGEIDDYFGNPIQLNLPQQKEVVVYVKPTPDMIGEYSYACTFFCGAGHGEMNGRIVISSS